MIVDLLQVIMSVSLMGHAVVHLVMNLKKTVL